MLRVVDRGGTFAIEADEGEMIRLLAEIADLGLYAREPVARPKAAPRVTELLRCWDQLLSAPGWCAQVEAVEPGTIACGDDDLPLVSIGQGTSRVDVPATRSRVTSPTQLASPVGVVS